jgi:two-component system, LytTR family, sensor kinase
MKLKVFAIILLFISINCFGQDLISNNVLDTLSFDRLGTRIEKEGDFNKVKKWNDLLIKESDRRQKIKNLPLKYKEYYRLSNLYSLLTDAYLNYENGLKKQAISTLFDILKKCKATDLKVFFYVYNNFGIWFEEDKDYKKALFYYQKALAYSIKLNDQYQSKVIKNALGALYQTNGNKKLALEYLLECHNYFSKTFDYQISGTIANNLSVIYTELKDYKNAIKYYDIGIRDNKKCNNFSELSRSYFGLYLLNKTEKSIDNLKLANKYALKSNRHKTIIQSSKKLTEYYKKKNDFKKAFQYQEDYLNSKEIIESADNKNAMLKAEFKYETEKKEAQIKDLSQQKKISELENKRQRTTLGLLIFGIISVLITSFLLFKRYKANKQTELLKSEIAKTQAENQATESELKALKSQMNPHFIFNALNSIQEQFMFGDKLVANEQMGNFTSLTRQILSVSGKKKIPLSSEIDILTKYLELEKMRFETDFDYAITCDDTIDDEYVELPPMLIQPFVENSIKHGLLHKEGIKKLDIHFALNEDETQLICTVTDNGIGRKKAENIKQKNQHNSFSTGSVAQRLQMINENDDQNLVYEDLEDHNGTGIGTKVVLKISLV